MRALILALSWDPTISAGTVLQGAMTLGGILLAYIGLRERLLQLETRLDPLWKEFVERRQTSRRAEDRR
jgi:hypothetical protein